MLIDPVTHRTDLVSVIIPIYNHAQYISDAIQSVLNQDYCPFEIVVVDDGSTDNTRDVVAKFGDKVTYIWQENQGLPVARNTGIAAATGEYIGLLDADDMYEPDFMSTLVSILKGDPDAGAVYCGYRFVNHLNCPLPQIEARQFPPDQLFQALVDGNFLVPESILVRKRCYEVVGPFDKALRACEDFDMWLRLTNQFKIIGDTHILTRHRILPDSMSTDPARQYQNRLAVIGKHFGPEPAVIQDECTPQRRAYGQAYLASTIEYLQFRNENYAFKCFQKMVNVCPELLGHINTFYELGCGEQPKGFRGDFTTLNIENSLRVVLNMLNNLFVDSDSASLKNYQRIAYANAYFAMGLLSYGAHQFENSRRFLIKSITYNPRFGFNMQLVKTLVMSLMDIKQLDWLRQKKRQLKASSK